MQENNKNDDSFGKLLPQNLDAERSVLGAMLLDTKVIPLVTEVIPNPDSFYSEIHRLIYQEILKLLNENKPVDIVTIKEELRKKNRLKDIGGAVYLADLVNSVPTTAHVLYYARLVREKKVLRDIIRASISIEALVQDGQPVENVLEKAQELIAKAAQETMPISKIFKVKEVAESLEMLIEKNIGADFPFKFEPLRKRCDGIDRGMVTVIGGYTSQAKSTLSIQLGDEFAEDGNKVAICSSEMPELQIAHRILCRRCHIDSWRMRKGNLTAEDKNLIREEIEGMDIPLWLSRVSTVGDVRRVVRKVSPDIIFVDHIHQMVGEGHSEYEMISNIIVGLKKLAMDEDISVVVVSQLHRTTQDGIRQPRLSDLRSSGRIEENAQLVLLIYWPWQIMGDGAKIGKKEVDENHVSLIIAKQTQGPVGMEEIYFKPEYCELTGIYEP